jgi:hypothetical protein
MDSRRRSGQMRRRLWLFLACIAVVAIVGTIVAVRSLTGSSSSTSHTSSIPGVSTTGDETLYQTGNGV